MILALRDIVDEQKTFVIISRAVHGLVIQQM